jgi:uncharacterized protein with GYD domain
MPYYLVQATYTPEAWARLVENPEDRREALGTMAERAGGTLHNSWLSFGDQDVVLLFEMPDNTRVASALMAAASSGAIKSLKTTPLLTWEEGLEAMRGASDVAYRPPGQGGG